MSIITFPSSLLSVAEFSWSQQRRDMMFSSIFGSQDVGVSTPLWMVTIGQSLIQDTNDSAGIWQSLALRLSGKVHQLELWNIMRPTPLGTLRGTLTMKVAHAQGASTLSLSGGSGQSGKTVKAGDYFGIGSVTTQQVVFATADATADGSGDITIDISATALRNAFITGSSVTWDKTKALFRQTASKQGWKYGQGKVVSGISLDLIEDWRP
jgi:hypothetical protein